MPTLSPHVNDDASVIHTPSCNAKKTYLQTAYLLSSFKKRDYQKCNISKKTEITVKLLGVNIENKQ